MGRHLMGKEWQPRPLTRSIAVKHTWPHEQVVYFVQSMFSWRPNDTRKEFCHVKVDDPVPTLLIACVER